MGFRDIAMFNDSLLAKQAWRLLKNPESLFYKVFTAYFFPNCTIVEAKCLEQYIAWEGCFTQGLLMGDWEWQGSEHMATSLVTKEKSTTSHFTYGGVICKGKSGIIY